jgi:hypothetical protein
LIFYSTPPSTPTSISILFLHHIYPTKMADVATASGAAMFDAGAVHKKPEKPDEDTYKANLKKAEKEHADAMVKLVSYWTVMLLWGVHFTNGNLQ